MHAPRAVLAVFAASVLAACGARTAAPPSGAAVSDAARGTSGVTLRYVLPSAANPHVDPRYDAYHVVAAPAAASKNLLFVFLPGSGAVPSAYKLVLEQAALHGFHAIGLEYPNGRTVDSLCARATSAACWGDEREAVLTGKKVSSVIAVAPVDSIERRLGDLLTYLAKTDATDGWQNFLKGGAPNWSRIAMGGHSQGGGDAAYAAKQLALDRSCSFDSPGDGNARFPIAAWLTMPAKTSPSRTYGFTNQDDLLLRYSRVQPEWQAMRFPGPPRDADGAKPPYANTHQLYTVRDVPSILESHGITVADAYTPIGAGGVPVYAPVWAYACFGAI